MPQVFAWFTCGPTIYNRRVIDHTAGANGVSGIFASV
jgi:hypothetical protein